MCEYNCHLFVPAHFEGLFMVTSMFGAIYVTKRCVK